MNYEAFYRQFFKPVVDEYGPLDPKTCFHIMGFDGGGPVNYNLVPAKLGTKFVTLVTCELAPRAEQKPNEFGTYELLMTCDDERWCSTLLTRIGQMSLDSTFDHGHTLDIGPCGEDKFPIQGVVFERFAIITIEGRNYGILRCHGITRQELEFAMQHGVDRLLECLRMAGVYPCTSIHRHSSVV